MTIQEDKRRYCPDCMRILAYDRTLVKYFCVNEYCKRTFIRENALTQSQLEQMIKDIQAEAEKLK